MKSCESKQKKTGRALHFLMAVLITSSTGACSDFKRAIGSQKSSPDEFEVVVRPPLSLPPGFSNSPDDIREGELAPTDSTALAGKILGVPDGNAGDFETLFDFTLVPINIREMVDEETFGIQFERRNSGQILFGGLPNIGPILDKAAEDQRIRRNLREGLLPTDVEILATDGASGETIIIK